MARQADNKLRVFADVDELFDNIDNEVILGWVNAYAKSVEYRKDFQRRNQAKKRLLLKYAAKLFDKDEMARINELAKQEADDVELDS